MLKGVVRKKGSKRVVEGVLVLVLVLEDMLKVVEGDMAMELIVFVLDLVAWGPRSQTCRGCHGSVGGLDLG